MSLNTNGNVDNLLAFISSYPKLLVLTGAGVSAGSGIPTYRDHRGAWQRSQPIVHQEFLTSKARRQRYWLRSYAGWPAVANATPSPTHYALTGLETRGSIQLIVTQNVDRLHQKANSKNVIDLHGRLDHVICLDCHTLYPRSDIQIKLYSLNTFLTDEGQLAPDGDADVDDSLICQVEIPDCEKCGGTLKPDVVFFGDSVCKKTVQAIYDAIDSCDAMLVAGSSLKVFSGFRFCRYAHDAGKPIASVNPGITRADDLMALRVAQPCDEVFPRLAEHFCQGLIEGREFEIE